MYFPSFYSLAGHLSKEGDQEQCDAFKKQAAEKLKTSFLDKFDPKEDTIYSGELIRMLPDVVCKFSNEW